MASMSELRNYKETQKNLNDRVNLLMTKEALAHIDWSECFDDNGKYLPGMREVANKKFEAWTEAINKVNATNTAFAYITEIIAEIEGK